MLPNSRWLHVAFFNIYCAQCFQGNLQKQVIHCFLQSLVALQPYGPVTLIGETWSGNIAFELAKLLEKNGRRYKVFLLEANPIEWKDRIKNLCLKPERLDFSLLKEILQMDLMVIPKYIKLLTTGTLSTKMKYSRILVYISSHCVRRLIRMKAPLRWLPNISKNVIHLEAMCGC